MIHLASKSPRRRELLSQLGLDFGVLDVDIPEHPAAGEPALDYVRRVAREKAGAGLLRVSGSPGAIVLAADTEVVADGEVFGKPVDAAQARAMLGRLNGREHQVISSVCVADAGREAQAQCISTVRFGQLDDEELDAYVACGEWQGKAGGYAIQGRGGSLVAHLSGSYSAVMGLPLYETRQLLRRFGVAL
jgi:septum formation protein